MSTSPFDEQSNFKVVVRVRPPLPRELSGVIPYKNIIAVDEEERQIAISENIDELVDGRGQLIDIDNKYITHHSFCFDHVYDQNSTQRGIFETTVWPVVESFLHGYNATVFAYGQTGTGKTYTMEGFSRGRDGEGALESRGIIPRAIEQIFGHINNCASPKLRFLVRASYLQIYNEQISDLLITDRVNLSIREDKRRGVFVAGLSEWVVKSPAEIYGLMERGAQVRATGETKMNEVSSRSHAVFIVTVDQSQTVYVDSGGREMTSEELSAMLLSRHGPSDLKDERSQQLLQRLLEEHVRQSFKVAKLNLVDLAGSERVRLSGAVGQRLEESKHINKSLSALGNVISALTDAKGRQHIPYRDSKLTRILEDSLGGNCKTTMMAMISPAFEAIQETLSTLKFANRAKNIRNEARVNEDLDQKSLLRKYELELKRLRAELEAKSKNVVDKRKLLELDEQRRRAEADKMAAIRALETRSREFMKEKEEKRRLEQRIASLMSQMIRGDQQRGRTSSEDRVTGAAPDSASNEGGPGVGVDAMEIQQLVKQHQERLRKEYDEKLADLERERESMGEERAQVDRYKQLLLKQRDIMIALTQRLLERDEQIMTLQDELDCADDQYRGVLERLDEKTALLIRLQRIAMEKFFLDHLWNGDRRIGKDLLASNSLISIPEVNARSPQPDNELARALEQSLVDAVQERGRVSTAQLVDSASASADSDEGSTSTADSPTGSGSGTTSVHIADKEKDDKTSLSSSSQLSYLSSYQAQCRLQSSDPAARTRAPPTQDVVQRAEQTVLSEIADREGDVDEAEPTSFGEDSAMVEMTQRILRKYADRDRGRSRVRDSARDENVYESEVTRLRAENERLQLQLRTVSQSALASVTKSTSDSSGSAGAVLSINALHDRCEALGKERSAVLTILEQKVLVLVESVGRAAGVVVGEGEGMASQTSEVEHALMKDLSSLQRLVAASVQALKHAIDADKGTSLPPQSPRQSPSQAPFQSATPRPRPGSTQSTPSWSLTPATAPLSSAHGHSNGLDRRTARPTDRPPPPPFPAHVAGSSSNLASTTSTYSPHRVSNNNAIPPDRPVSSNHIERFSDGNAFSTARNDLRKSVR